MAPQDLSHRSSEISDAHQNLSDTLSRLDVHCREAGRSLLR